MKEVYFIRHGESEANSREICAGHTDVELTEEGLEQARNAGEELKQLDKKIDLIISSPLKRALATAVKIAQTIDYPEDKIEVNQDAIERFRGDFEGMPSSAQDGITDKEYAEHGAETEASMIIRAERLLRAVEKRGEQTCLIVSHNQFGRSLVAHARGIARDKIEKLPNAHAFRLDMPTSEDLLSDIQKATATYPRFSDGRIDYSHERVCFVLNCVVIAGEQVLLTKRSADVIAYPNTINGVSGFIDETSGSLEEVARQELREELALPDELIKSIAVSRPFIQIDDEIDREWHVFAVLVELHKAFSPEVNWENKSAEWFDIKTAHNMKLMRGFSETLDIAIAMR